MSRISSEPQGLPNNIKDEPEPKSVSTVDIALIKQKVGEIYKEAGNAFNLLLNMTMSVSIGDTQPGGKWTEKEMEMLRDCLHRFALDLNKLSQHIKSRTVLVFFIPSHK